jgi:peptidoglycan/xylan/chitin deacetylase (PgdA/CDA1 family)
MRREPSGRENLGSGEQNVPQPGSDENTSPILSPNFDYAKVDKRESSARAIVSGKVSRFLARNVRTKSAIMRNTGPLVSFTFDDVPASACDVGAPILERHGACGTFYVCGGGCGAPSPCGVLASAGQLRDLWAKGHEIGCHTYSHPAVTGISERELAADLARNQDFFNAIEWGIRARNFAYPYGNFSFHTKRLIERGFDSCRSLIHGVNAGRVDFGALKTWCLENASMDRARVAALIAETVRVRGWLIFTSHDVGDAPSRYGVTPDLFNFAVTTAQQEGCSAVTVAGALKLVTEPAVS